MQTDNKTKLKGAFDLLFLFGRGINAFSGTKHDALRSFVIPAVLFIITLPASYFYPPKGMESGYHYSQIFITVALQAIFSVTFSIALVYVLAHLFNKLDKFWLFLEASNWTTLAASIIILPLITGALIFGWFPREEMERIFVIVQCYLYLVTSCVVFRSFQLNWQLSGFITITILFSDQMAWDILFRLQGIIKPW